jgi:hypothetical protein
MTMRIPLHGGTEGFPVGDGAPWRYTSIGTERHRANSTIIDAANNRLHDILAPLEIMKRSVGIKKMKRIAPILILLAAGGVSAAPPVQPSTVIYDPRTDVEAFSFVPTPATCELHVVDSNVLAWVRYDGRQLGRAWAYDTTVYLQERVGQKPTHIVKFGGRQMPKILGVTANGSLLFERGEEFIASGDACARYSSDADGFFICDTRNACPFDVQTVTSPSTFLRRLSQEKTPHFTLPVFRKGDQKVMREITVAAVPSDSDPMWKQMASGALPSPEWLRHLWPIAQWDVSGFTIWNGTEWTQFNWDANQ